MEVLPDEIVREILSWVITNNWMSTGSKMLVRAVCRSWNAHVDFNDLNIYKQFDAQQAIQLRDTLLKRSRSFGLSLSDCVPDSSIFFGPLSHLTSLTYPATLPVLEYVTNLQKITAYAAHADWLLRQSNLTSLSLSALHGHDLALLHGRLSNLQSLGFTGLGSSEVLAATTATNLTHLEISAYKPFEIAKYSNLKSLILRAVRGVSMSTNLPNLESLRLPRMLGHITAPQLTELVVTNPHDRVLDVLPGLTALKVLVGGWHTADPVQLTNFTALTRLQRLMLSTVDTAQVLRYVQASNMTQLNISPSHTSRGDVQHLERMTNLRTLILKAHSPINLSVLAPLTRLEELTLGYECSGLSVITALTRLCSFTLANNLPTEISCSAMSRVTMLEVKVIDAPVILTDTTALQRLEDLATPAEMDFNQLPVAHITRLCVSNHNDTLWHNLVRMPALQDLVLPHLDNNEHLIALSVLTKLTSLSVAPCSIDGRELTRLTSLEYLQFITSNGSQKIKDELTHKLVNLQQNTYVFTSSQ
jgi:hypothetical protein